MSLISRVHSVFERSISDETLKAVVDHLERFGYIEEGDLDGLSDVRVRDVVVAAIGKLAEHAGIHLTGIWLFDLVALYRFIRRNPRCSVSEKLEEQPEAAMSRWTKRQLTYYIERVPRGCSKGAFSAAVSDYFNNWTAVADISFSERDQSSTDIIVSTGRGPGQNFDGAGGTLAWAYLPNGSDSQLLMRFDDDETFTTDPTGRGTQLENVSTHEFGHLIGISHAPNATSLMSPYYNKSIATPRAWDISQAQTRYGAPKSAPPSPPATPPVPPVPTPPAEPVNPYLVDVRTIIIPGHRII